MELRHVAADTCRAAGRHLQCSLCSREIRAKQPSRPYGTGRAHVTCISRRARAAAPANKPVPRTRRPYDAIGPTQRRERRKQLRLGIVAAEQQACCPLQTLQLHPRLSPAELIHLPTAVREQIRSIPSLRIPSEQSMIKCKQQLASSHATETSTFANGAYLADPVRFVSVLCAQSSFIAVGGDAGGGRCVLGVTYGVKEPRSEKQAQHFAPLLVYEGGDSWLELQDCRAEGLTPFTGDSAAFPHIWAVLQHLIDHKSVSTNASSAKL